MTTNNKLSLHRLRFKQFTGEWVPVRFDNIYKKNTEKNGNQFSNDRTISISQMKFNSEGNGASAESLQKYKVIRKGDIAFEGHANKKFDFGRFVMNDIGDGIMSPRFACLRPINPIVISFWKYYIHTENVIRPILVKSTKLGTMMNELVLSDLNKQSINVPSTEEQQKIGAFFSKLDQLIDLQAHKIDQLQRLKRGYLQKLFPQPGEAVPRLRFNGFTDEWKEKQLKDFSIVKDGDWIESNYIFDKGDYRIIQTGNIGLGNFIDKDKEKYILQNGFQELKTTEVKAGDLLICRLADPVGRAILAPSIHKKMVTSVDIAIVYPENNISKTFLKCLFNTEMMLNINLRLSSGTTRIRISRKNLANIELEIPSYEEQQKIGDFFKRMDNKIELQNKKLDELKQLKKAYLQKMFI